MAIKPYIRNISKLNIPDKRIGVAANFCFLERRVMRNKSTERMSYLVLSWDEIYFASTKDLMLQRMI
jgi:hypothetical protein